MYQFPNSNAFYADHYATAQQQQPYMQQSAPAPTEDYQHYVGMQPSHDQYDQSLHSLQQQQQSHHQTEYSMQHQQHDAHWQEDLQHAQQYLLPVQQLQQPHERLGCTQVELDKFMRMRKNYMSTRRMREAQQRLVIGNISHSVDRPVKFTPASASRDRRAAAYAKQLMEQQPQEVDWTAPMDKSDHTQYTQSEHHHDLSTHNAMEWPAAEPLQGEPMVDPTTTDCEQEVVGLDNDYEELTRAAKQFLSDLPVKEEHCSQVPKEEEASESVAVQPASEAPATVDTASRSEPATFANSLVANNEKMAVTDSRIITNPSANSVNQGMEESTAKNLPKEVVCDRQHTIAMLVEEIKRIERGGMEIVVLSHMASAQESASIVESPAVVDEQLNDNNDEATLEDSRDERMKLYETGNAFKKFPQLEKNTNLLLSDLAATLDKKLSELIAANDKLWDALGKIKDHLKKEDVKACEDASHGNPDFLNLLYLVAFLNGSRRNAKIDRVNRLYTTMNYSSPALALAALGDSNMNQPLAFKCSNSSSLYLSLDGRAIPVEKDGLRLAVLSVVAGTHLLNLAIDQQVGDVVRFFYSAAGLELLRKPVAVAKAREIIGV